MTLTFQTQTLAQFISVQRHDDRDRYFGRGRQRFGCKSPLDSCLNKQIMLCNGSLGLLMCACAAKALVKIMMQMCSSYTHSVWP